MTPNIQTFNHLTPQWAEGVYLHHSVILIGHVNIGADSSVWPHAVIRGDVNSIHIGRGSNIQDLSMLHVSHPSSQDPAGSPLIIGNDVTIGHSVILHGCTIEDDCLIGMGSIVMDNAIIHKNVLLAAGSLVPEGKVLESGYLYMGRPAKKIRALTDAELANFMNSAMHYMDLKNQYLA